jgi:hypothetical protein
MIQYSEEFILKVNEIYHNVEGKEYQKIHPEAVFNCMEEMFD